MTPSIRVTTPTHPACCLEIDGKQYLFTNNMEDCDDSSTSSASSLKFPTLDSCIPLQTISDAIRDSRLQPPATMSAVSETHSDDHNLSESGYEFIDTDTESRDGNTTESIASTDFGRPDDIASLADTDRSGDSEEDAGIPTFSDLDGPIDTPIVAQSSATVLDDVSTAASQYIEFEEPELLGEEDISVTHTIANFDNSRDLKGADKEKYEAIFGEASGPQSLQGLRATIRQTMTRQCLSTEEPLRVLWSGSHEGKNDVIRKLGSAVTASGEDGSEHSPASRSSSLYNVVPVSAFGTGKVSDVELMHSSGYQMNVEDVVDATNLTFEDESGKPDVIKLTLEDNYKYHSVPESSQFTIEPTWKLPHVAVLYYSDNDSIATRRTLHLTRTFMSRHRVPSVLICREQKLFLAADLDISHHTIHMCLESRGTGRNHILKRLPIDLASFLKVDSRQMNRNLAYLTGLHEPLPSTSLTEDKSSVSLEVGETTRWFETIWTMANQHRNLLTEICAALFGLVIALFLAPQFRSASYGNSVTVNGNRTFTETTSILLSTESAHGISTSRTISTKYSTSTTTITITVPPSSLPKPAELSTRPLHELSQVAVAVKPKEVKPSICGAEVISDREILIRIPYAAKVSWLSKDSFFMNITRNDIAVTTERLYSTNEGILLQFFKKDAYGSLNITICTKRQPKINETFLVDFGTTIYRELWTLFGKLADDVAHGQETFAQTVTEQFGKAVLEAKDFSESAITRLGELEVIAAKHAKELSMDAARKSAIISKELGNAIQDIKIKVAHQIEGLRKERASDFARGLSRAQVQSKLFYLKMKGNMVAYEKYKARAEQYFKEAGDLKVSNTGDKNIKGCSARKSKKCVKPNRKRCGKCQGRA